MTITTTKINIQKYGEVFTPMECVNILIDKYVPEDKFTIGSKWLDPTCGTGNFLMGIYYKLLNEIGVSKTILENMIYGADIRPANAYMAAHRLDPSSSYDLHIEQADGLFFNYWDEKFDVIIGNPPYLGLDNIPGADVRRDLKLKYKSLSEKQADISWAFIEKSLDMLTDDGLLIFITSDTWMKGDSAKHIRDITKDHVVEINMDLGRKYFDRMVSTSVFVFKKQKQTTPVIVDNKEYPRENFTSDEWSFNERTIVDGPTLYEVGIDFVIGIGTGNSKAYIQKFKDEDWNRVCVRGSDVNKLANNEITFPQLEYRMVWPTELTQEKLDKIKKALCDYELVLSDSYGDEWVGQHYCSGKNKRLKIWRDEKDKWVISRRVTDIKAWVKIPGTAIANDTVYALDVPDSLSENAVIDMFKNCDEINKQFKEIAAQVYGNSDTLQIDSYLLKKIRIPNKWLAQLTASA